MQDLKNQIREKFDAADDKFAFINDIRDFLHEMSPVKCNPVDRVTWVPKSKVIANNYNPNHVAPKEMTLLHTSIKEDGYTHLRIDYKDSGVGSRACGPDLEEKYRLKEKEICFEIFIMPIA